MLRHSRDAILWRSREVQKQICFLDATIIIGVNIQQMSKWNFSSFMGSAAIDYGYDLMLTDIGNRYAVNVGSQKGEDLLSK